MTNTPGWDSLRHILVMSELERVSGQKFTYKEMTGATSVSKILELLAAKGVVAEPTSDAGG